MRFRSLVVLAVAFVLSAGAYAGWPRHDMNRDGIINFADLTQAVQSGDYQLVNMVLSHWGQNVLTTPTGAPNAPGADAKAIARWNMVPWQTMTGESNVGVVAFHINGISAVSFSVNGGAWVDVTEMTLNPESDTHEYWIRVNASDYADGEVEIRAVAFPVNGLPRGLMGVIDGSLAYRNGNHSLMLFVDSDSTAPSHFVYCAPWGSDTTGDGTLTNPFRQPTLAASKMSQLHGNASGGTVYLLPGEYSFGPKVHPVPTTEGRWLTFRPAPGVSKSAVRITDAGIGGTGAKLIKLENLSLIGSFRLRQSRSDFIWLHNCYINQIDRTTALDLVNPTHWGGIYATDLMIEETSHSVRDATYIRNVTVDMVSRSPFGSSPMVINSRATRYDRGDTNNHGDVFHWLSRSNTENVIIYGVKATQFKTQGIFAEVYGEPYSFDNVALVNLHISRDADSAAGSWWETTTDHLLMWNVSLPDQPLRWKLHAFGSSLRNVSIRGSVFERFTFDDPSEFPNANIHDNHFVNLTSFGSFATGTRFTVGDPRFRNPSSGDYRPAPGSPLLNRLPHGLTPTDVLGNLRGRPTAIGSHVNHGN